jgi:predicted heme/steroid binding protein/CheY-like chemotaxis protein/uncharacterized membrane protein
MEQLRILLVEDNPADARLIQDMLEDAGATHFAIDWKQTLAGGLKSISEKRYDAILLDLGLPDSPQRSVSFTRTQTAAPAIPIIILTGLDDDTFAVTTVRRGAQDYLVKGKTDTNTLVRTIRYAVARKLGGERTFTLAELAQYDGREGRAAYFAYKGKVYDATNSRLWREGKHGVVHLAGKDLTEALAAAPHGEDRIARLPILGDLTKKPTYQQLLLRRIDSVHPHTTLVHLNIAYAVLAPFIFLGFIISGRGIFDEITLYLVIAGLATVILSFISGFIGWVVSYESKASRVFNFKIALGILSFLLILAILIWRVTSPQVIINQPWSYVYITVLFLQLAIALILDYYGKRIVYS